MDLLLGCRVVVDRSKCVTLFVRETRLLSAVVMSVREAERLGGIVQAVWLCQQKAANLRKPLLLEYDKLFGDNRRFFSTAMISSNGSLGLGNKLFEIVSTYGIARTLNRR
jgi:hypothetical protein